MFPLMSNTIFRSSSIEEAARMSVLSRSWRHVWAEIPKLVLSPQFCKSKPSVTLIDIVNTILLRHSGAIKTFLVNISSIPSSEHYVIDQWMLCLSKNGITDLTLQNLNSNYRPYTLPSCMYGVQLERLELSSCIFKPPRCFKGFDKLKRLLLDHVILKLDDIATNSFLWMPNLDCLKIRFINDTLRLNAPNLLRVSYRTTSPRTLKLDHLMGCRKLETVVLKSRGHEQKVMNLTYLLNCWPEVRSLHLESYYLKSFAYSVTKAETLPTCLNTCLNSLIRPAPFDFNFDDEELTYSLLRMLSSCPNVEELRFTSSLKKKGGMEVEAMNHFEGPASAPLLLKAIIKLDQKVLMKANTRASQMS